MSDQGHSTSLVLIKLKACGTVLKLYDHNLSDKYMQNFRSWHFGKLTFWGLTFWKLTFWELTCWEEPQSVGTLTPVMSTLHKL